MKVMIKVPQKRWKHLRRRVRTAEFADKASMLSGKEVCGGYRWATFTSRYLSDTVKACGMLPEGSECWQIEHTNDGCVAISSVCLLAATMV